MKNYLTIIFLTLFTQCGNILGEGDTEMMTPENLNGTWVRIEYVEIAGHLIRDTIVYRIGMDKVVDSIPYNVYNTKTFNAESDFSAYTINGFIYQDFDLQGKSGTEYDEYERAGCVRFFLKMRKSGGYETRGITFSYTSAKTTDTIVVKIDGNRKENFGLKRRGL